MTITAPIVIRLYQKDAIQRMRDAIRRGCRRIILVAPTGAGKTVMAAEIIKCAVEKGKRVLFLAHRRELIHQCSEKLSRFGVPHGIVMAGEDECVYAPVQVASKDTLLSRAIRRKKIQLPPADIVFIDEAHRSLSKWYKHLVELYPSAVLIGLTATPARGDGRGLGELYETMVESAKCSQLVKEGYLVPVRAFAPYRPDLKGVRYTKKDYLLDDLQLRMDKPQLIGDVVEKWLELAADRQTIVFASGVEHSIHLKDKFIAAGIAAAHIDAKTPLDERADILRWFTTGDVQVICNCDVLTEGVDLPCASCVVLARPTRSIVVFRQQIGRILRPFEGKVDALIIDHAGSIYRHGFPDDDITWSLDSKTRVEQSVQENFKQHPGSVPTVCKKCFCAYRGSQCPNCGHRAQRRGRSVEMKDGHLTELKRGEVHEIGHEERQRYWHKCLAIGAHKGWRCAIAAVMYKKQFGDWPKGLKNLHTREQNHLLIRDVFPQYLRGVA